MPPRRGRRFRWSVPLGRVAGIRISVHLSFLLLVALVVAYPGPLGIVGGLVWIVIVFACVVLHELAHSVVAQARGGRVHAILLLPIGGVSQIERLPEGWVNELLVAAAGPAASLLIAGLAALAAVGFGHDLLPIDLARGPVTTRLLWINLLLAGFNLLPAFPLDGGRILRAALEPRRGVEAATRAAATAGRVFGGLMIAAGLLWDLWLVVIGVFVILGATQEQTVTEAHLRLQGVPARVAMRAPAATLDARWPLPFPHSGGGPWPVTLDGRYLGMAREHDLTASTHGTVADVTDTTVEPLRPDEDLGRTGLDKLIAADGQTLPVVDGGAVLGVVRIADLGPWLERPTLGAGPPPRR